ncbi:LysR family transcriptional regulator [Lacibacterium aquatile]|uniref:LysR family transcriptional regulator n=1 Tax=Lacibacterium aquatile TaxID=1168082 RepID=A0ABW5DWH8_9PROT
MKYMNKKDIFITLKTVKIISPLNTEEFSEKYISYWNVSCRNLTCDYLDVEIMHIRHLEILHALMLTGTITSAAQLLNISQPTATRLLLRAEDLLGYKLFERVRGRFVPTREGQILHAESEPLIRGLDGLRKLARNLGSTTTECLHIAAAPAMCAQLIPMAITRFRRKYPNVSFEVETRQYADLVRGVLTHEADIGIGFDVESHAGLDMVKIARAPFFGAFPAKDAATLPPTVSLDIFRSFPIVGLQGNDPIGAACEKALKAADIDLDPIVLVKTNQIALSLVSRGDCAAIIDLYTAATHDPRLVTVRQIEPPFAVEIHGLRARNQPASVVSRDFLATVKIVEAEIAQRLQRQAGPIHEEIPPK